MSNGTLDLTVTGWVGSDVTTLPAQDGRAAYTTFRLGSTRRWWNRATNAWQDSQTEWFQVKAWRTLAVNAGLSLKKGVPVVVQGRLATREWQDEHGAVRTTLVLEATAIGLDLSYGTVGQFQRTLSGAAAQAPDEVRHERGPIDVTALTEAGSALGDASEEPPDDELVDGGHVLGDDTGEPEVGTDGGKAARGRRPSLAAAGA
ncbi:single-stranded DNA-binding protein [Cellulomonas gilvus]|uniref:Single-stranded DNA-binding protein n=1 Tax=Cellulomonas gilvus (strain ATCC 13127 / NRRL B-14078) TaxID=593907 RepID=F8A0N0_CELGA|nr:single-stranded DNA-binding protein [Cellulomonas gilvus]AEI12715.1 single-strand binding protein [Cellulomonas gilvus ATCC 13127]